MEGVCTLVVGEIGAPGSIADAKCCP